MTREYETRDEIVTHLTQLIEDKKRVKLEEFLKDIHPADIVDAFKEIDNVKHQKFILGFLDDDTIVEVLNKLNPELIVELLEGKSPKRISQVLEKMPFDDVADFLNELPDKQKDKFLGLFEGHDAEDVQELMDYANDTAGGLMTTEFVALPEYITVEKSIQALREIAPNAETIYYVYVINLKNQLVGVISLRELLIANPQTEIRDLMRQSVITVNVKEDQELVARKVSKYDFIAIPVVDDEEHLLGIITVDDIIDVIHEEASEDIYRLGGTYLAEGDEEGYDKYSVAVRSRLPWLLITMVGGLISGQVLKGFSDQISAVVALSFFIPLLTGMGGNVGTQSSTVTVRGIATGQINAGTVTKTILKESMVGVSMGLVLGSLVATVAYVWQGSVVLGLVVGLAMLGNMFTAATMGTLVPIIFKKIGVDPAVASAPFISTSIDIVGLVIYSSLATLLLNYMM